MKCDELEKFDAASNADLSAGYDHREAGGGLGRPERGDLHVQGNQVGQIIWELQ